MALVGHGWAVTFGSMGSSYYTIQLVTGIEGEVIAPHMALLFAPIIVASGMLVAHIQGGLSAVRRSLPMVVVAGGLMAAAMYVLRMGRRSADSVHRPRRARNGGARLALPYTTPPRGPADGGRPRGPACGSIRRARCSSHAVHPRLHAVPAAHHSERHIADRPGEGGRAHILWALDYPAFTTAQGFAVAAANDYAPLRILNHPAPLIFFSIVLSAIVYVIAKRWRRGVAWEAMKLTYSQSLSSTIGVTTMVMMAVVMADTGMTVLLAQGIANASGPLFPFVSPFIGLLGSFMSGSNTNSNVMFGLLQLETARALDIGTVTISSIQSIGASVGSPMAPAKVLVGAAVVGLAGKERDIFRIVIPYILGLVVLAGIEAIIIIELLPALSR